MRVLLIGMEPLVSGIGIRYLSSYLKGKGNEVNILFSPKKRPTAGEPFAESEDELGAIADFAADLDVDVIGISLMTHHFHRSANLTGELRRKLDVPIVWGGVHPTYSPGECLQYADYVFFGESEKSLSRFLSQMDKGETPDTTPGISYPNGDGLKSTPPAGFIEDLDEIPILDISGDTLFVLDDGRIRNLGPELYRRYSSWNGTWYRLTTSRGCPYNCAYCTGGMTRKVRRRSTDNVFEEVDRVLEQYPFTKVLNIQDDSFFLGDDEWLGDFSSRLRDEYGLKFMCRLMPKYVTEKRIDILYDGGLRYISMGLQTGSERVNYDIYNRRETAPEFLRAETVLSKFGIQRVYDVIFDNPYESEEESKETVKTIASCKKPFLVYAYSLTPYPGTTFYERAKYDGWLDKMTDPYESPFRVTRSDNYTTPVYLRRLLYITTLLPRRVVLYLVDRTDFVLVRALIGSVYYLYRASINIVNFVRERFPNVVVKVANLFRKTEH
ncbi:MAG: B12-binding domain-containing radical SAM protein [bacterium]|nr:B12-binding domain-containing radical SAM protein [bacterium]